MQIHLNPVLLTATTAAVGMGGVALASLLADTKSAGIPNSNITHRGNFMQGGGFYMMTLAALSLSIGVLDPPKLPIAAGLAAASIAAMMVGGSETVTSA